MAIFAAFVSRFLASCPGAPAAAIPEDPGSLPPAQLKLGHIRGLCQPVPGILSWRTGCGHS
nr:hypothetical protein P5635_00195 [Bacillus subtilis]